MSGDSTARVILSLMEGERWGYPQISVYLAGQGHPASEVTLRSYKRKGVLVAPDATHPDAPNHPLWWPMTVMTWDSNRPGRGKPRSGKRQTKTTTGERAA